VARGIAVVAIKFNHLLCGNPSTGFDRLVPSDELRRAACAAHVARRAVECLLPSIVRLWLKCHLPSVQRHQPDRSGERARVPGNVVLGM
jgi:hypothetical protein